MVRESHQFHLRTRIQWFSILLGLKSSVSGVISEIKSLSGHGGGANWAVTTLTHQYAKGSRSGTRRWAIAWSWLGFRPGWGSAVAGISARGIQGLGVKPFKGVLKFNIPVAKPPLKWSDHVMGELVHVLGELEEMEGGEKGRAVCWEVEDSKGGEDGEQTLNGWIKGDIWSRAARRRRLRSTAKSGDESPALSCEKQEEHVSWHVTPRDGLFEEDLQGMWFRISVGRVSNGGDEDRDEGDEDESIFGESVNNSLSPCLHREEHGSEEYCPTPPPQPYLYQDPPITPRPLSNIQRGFDKTGQERPITVTLRWIRGHPRDTVLFESFCGMYRRKLVLA